MAYCETDDLMLGKINPPRNVDLQSFVNDAADEIDSQIGFVYKTPIAGDPELPRPVSLLLKRLNRFIATGRLIMAVTAATEDDTTHAYANRLLREAGETLKMISRGDLTLEGAELLPGEKETARGPKIVNVDKTSPTDDFYTGMLGEGQQVFRGFGWANGDAEYRPAGG